MQRRNFIKATAVSLAFAAAGFASAPVIAADTIKVRHPDIAELV
jgi:hypothetical protein